jgi:hypothetical protein
MRNAVIVGVAVTFFGLGAFVSPGLKAQDTPKSDTLDASWIPVRPNVGDIVVHKPSVVRCEAEAVEREWVKCNDVWWNLASGAGYAVRQDRTR